jgi:hypothetical protein
MRRVIKRFIKNKVFDRNCIQSWSYSLKHVKHKTVSSSLLKARYGFERTNAHFQFWFHIFFSFCLSIYLFKNSESLSVSFYDFIWVILWISSLSLCSLLLSLLHFYDYDIASFYFIFKYQVHLWRKKCFISFEWVNYWCPPPLAVLFFTPKPYSHFHILIQL